MPLIPEKTGFRPSGVGLRLALMLALAVLPLGAFNLWQNWALTAEAVTQSEAALLGQTADAVASEVALIRGMQATARLLALAVPSFADDAQQCTRVMMGAARADERYSLVGLTRLDGIMSCNSLNRRFDFGDNPTFQRLLRMETPFLGVNLQSSVTGGSILGTTHPVYGWDGRYIGVLSVSVPHTRIQMEPLSASGAMPSALPDAGQFFTLDSQGTVLTSTIGLAQAAEVMPRGLDLTTLGAGGSRTLTGMSVGGTKRTYAIIEMTDEQLYLVGSWQGDALAGLNRVSVAGYVFPVAMALASILGALLVGNVLVTGHIRRLVEAMRHFGAGLRQTKPVTRPTAPSDIRALGNAFEEMKARLQRDAADLENTVHQRDILLREVHHRVKNNLQLITSIISLQLRHAKSDEARQLLRELQDRVLTLATIHRELYMTSSEPHVRADDLIREVAERIVKLGSGVGRKVRSQYDLAEVWLPPDQAVPLSLIITEALTNAVKYASAPPGDTADITASLWIDPDGVVTAEVTNSLTSTAPLFAGSLPEMAIVPTGPPPDGTVRPGTGLGMTLMRAFAHQIDAALKTTHGQDRYVLRLSFCTFPTTEAPAGEAAA